MKVLVCPDKFRESLSASEAAQAITEGLIRVFPEANITQIQLADGGEGTVEALVSATKGEIIECEVTGPIGEKVKAFFGILGDKKTAVIEMAAASGLHLVPIQKRNPLNTTTYGTGELIKAAVRKGCSRIIIGIGGSATNDGGAGMAQALGAQLIDLHGRSIGWGGGSLKKLEKIVLSGIPAEFSKVDVLVASDVINPLYGSNGASRIYGPQKGASPEMVEELEAAIIHYSEVIQRDLGKDVKDIAGAGAAGGLGAGLIVFLNAEIRPGIDIVLETVKFREKMEDVDFIITGEGKIDQQTAFGKTVSGVLKFAREFNIPVIGVAGTIGEGANILYKEGLTSIINITSRPMTVKEAMENAYELVVDAIERAMRLLELGSKLTRTRSFRDP